MSSMLDTNFVPSQPDLPSPPPSVSDTLSSDDALWSTEHLAAPYGNYDIATSYSWNNGVLMAPVMEPVTGTLVPADIISYAAPYGIKTVRWTASRSGFPPSIPDPTPTDPNLVLHSFGITPMANKLDTDGVTEMYSCSGVYVYLCLTPVPPSTGYVQGRPRQFNPTNTQNYDSFRFVQGII